MAIFIFGSDAPIRSLWRWLRVVVSGTVLLSATPAVGAGYMISARDKAQANTFAQQAYAAYQTGDYAQALQLLGRSDALKPDQPDGWNLRGMIYLKQSAYDQAQAAFARAAALDPELWAAQFNLAEASFQRRAYARARADFERLLSHTDRFKEKNKWELVQYKAIVCSALLGDDRAVDRKLAKLPPTGGATPAYYYARAALAFRHKDPSLAQKNLLQAQAAFPVAVNDLFADSLVRAGWQSPPVAMAALAANVPYSPSAGAGAPMVIDPQLLADSAGPLPVADAPVRPIVGMVIPPPPLAVLSRSKTRSAPALVAKTPPVPIAEAGMELENGGLLLDE